ncbi:MAG TPA: tRNA pseudouridine(55) synthase TruB [Spirochaetia bacterium]|nr:tRNA pseudouridine(55) synthase TruB [Spirochaetia bacterium]
MSEFTGVALIDKPAGISSFAALFPLKRAALTKRVGHTGTLDPFATGLMVALFGPLTRLAPLFTGMDKEYLAEFQFGRETDSADLTGATVREASVPDFQTIESSITGFVGTIFQNPPMFSAVHVGGRRAYELARSGTVVKIPGREITITNIEIISWNAPNLEVRVRCSSGTYIRSLAQDLGQTCGSAAHVSRLRRVAVGPFRVDHPAACAPESFDPRMNLLSARKALSVTEAVKIRDVSVDQARRVATGGAITCGEISPDICADGMYALFSPDGSLQAVVETAGHRVSYRFVVPRSA